MAHIRHKNHRGFAVFISGALIAFSGQAALCQTSSALTSSTPSVTTTSSQQAPAYEVATIKPTPPDRFRISVRRYIQSAFGLPINSTGLVIGGPDWMDSASYVIQGKPPDAIRDAMQAMTLQERANESRLMQQSLLADRFKLKAHYETREMPGYELIVAKGGSKLKESSDPSKGQGAVGGSAIRGMGVPMTFVVGALESLSETGHRVVVDKTGLTGNYDLMLRWTPMNVSSASGDASGNAQPSAAESVSLFTAIEEQLGLKLVPTKAPTQVLVIDHIEKPTEN